MRMPSDDKSGKENRMSKRNTALRLTIAVLVGVMAFSSAQGQHSIPEVTIQKDSSSGELNVSNSGERVTLKAGKLAGVLHGNVSNAGRDGAGLIRYATRIIPTVRCTARTK